MCAPDVPQEFTCAPLRICERDSWGMGGIHGIPGGPRGGGHKILGEARDWHWIPGEIVEVPGESVEFIWEDLWAFEAHGTQSVKLRPSRKHFLTAQVGGKCNVAFI